MTNRVSWLSVKRYKLPEDTSFLLNDLEEKENEVLELRAQVAALQESDQKMRSENQRLRAALRPFAEAADGFDMTRIKNPEEWFAYRGIVSATESRGAITVGDLRRARAALEGK